ncbi:DUF6891 domain-containing protein [Blastopirellula marina]|uniref:DUF6891 domain-containing protein n=1 Tax=Blastopirellula marina DSM 3645 TaxID=314230 RepID=A4A2A8_9BACT|nr:hypothetical protein [Blastopirellula marina]EAQ77074.1 hypothetical protein DSM3645_25609 [Blastopirellula marina DSM 3645]
MSQNNDWNDASRAELRATIRNFILGELRLKRLAPEDLLDSCCASIIEEESPAEEEADFEQFAEEEVERIKTELQSEEATWPAETDCDRLDRVELELRKRGILLWQVSPCCDTCTVSEISLRIDAIELREPGFKDQVRGYSFFIDQNMPESLAETTETSVYLGYGWLSPADSKDAADDYETNALGIAREVEGCLRDEGFEVNWDGSFSRKIGLALNWRRRNLLA